MKIKLLLLTYIFYSLPLHARMAIEEDFNYFYENTHAEVLLNDDGSSVDNIVMDIKINKDSGIEFFSPYKLSFDPVAEEITVIEANVSNGNEIHKVNPANIQISNIAAVGQGLVTLSEVAIPFSKLRVGSLVHMKIKIVNKRGPLGKFYSMFSDYGQKIFAKKDSLKIISPRRIFFKKNDPHGVLKVTQNKDKNNKFIFEAILVRPYSNMTSGELGVIPKKDYTTLEVSNIDKWDTLKKMFNIRLPATRASNLPQEIRTIISSIPKQGPLEQKIHLIMKYITKEYKYLGDWRGKGKYIPKDLNKIVEDKFGDCKDFSTLLIVMLKELNVNANYAVVERSNFPAEVDETHIPSINYFNHMIVRVEDKGEVFWIDPTNNYSIGTKFRKDISDRNAFILGENTPLFEKIPKIDKEKNVLGMTKEFIFTSAAEATVNLVSNSSGENAYLSWDIIHGKEADTAQEVVMKLLTAGERKVVSSFELVSNEEKIYKDFSLKSKYFATSIGIKDHINQSYVMQLPFLSMTQFFHKLDKKGKGHFDISAIPSVSIEYQYKNIFMTGNYPVVCDIQSDWVDAQRKIERTAQGFYLKDKIVFKKDVMTPQDYGHDGFNHVASELANCFSANPIAYTFEPAASVAGTSSKGRSPASHSDINLIKEDGYSKLSVDKRIKKRLDLALEIIEASIETVNPDGLTSEDARMMLEKNLEDNPKDYMSLRALALYHFHRSYISGDDYEKNGIERAKKFIDEALTYAPDNITVNLTKVYIVKALKKDEEAKALLNSSIMTLDRHKLSFRDAKRITQLSGGFKDNQKFNEFYNLAYSKAKDDSERSDLISTRASYKSHANDFQGCIEDFLASDKLKSLDAWDNGNIAICHYQLKQYEEAIKYGKRAIAIQNYGAVHGTLKKAYLFRGWELMAQDKDDEAQKYLQLSLLEEPHSETYRGLAKLYLKKNDVVRAREQAQKAMKVAENPEETKALLMQIFSAAKVPYE